MESGHIAGSRWPWHELTYSDVITENFRQVFPTQGGRNGQEHPLAEASLAPYNVILQEQFFQVVLHWSPCKNIQPTVFVHRTQ